MLAVTADQIASISEHQPHTAAVTTVSDPAWSRLPEFCPSAHSSSFHIAFQIFNSHPGAVSTAGCEALAVRPRAPLPSNPYRQDSGHYGQACSLPTATALTRLCYGHAGQRFTLPTCPQIGLALCLLYFFKQCGYISKSGGQRHRAACCRLHQCAKPGAGGHGPRNDKL